jgi:transposase-like protein
MEIQLYEKHSSSVTSNRRNGISEKTIIKPVNLDILEIREFELLSLNIKTFPEMDHKIIIMYKGMSVRDIQSTLKQLYGVMASPELILK